jgi:hypothetical protein
MAFLEVQYKFVVPAICEYLCCYDPSGRIKGRNTDRIGAMCYWGQGCTTADYVKAIKKEKLCGHEDWRVPTIEELGTLALKDSRGRLANLSYVFPFWGSKEEYFSSSVHPTYNRNLQIFSEKKGIARSFASPRTSDQKLRLVRVN